MHPSAFMRFLLVDSLQLFADLDGDRPAGRNLNSPDGDRISAGAT